MINKGIMLLLIPLLFIGCSSTQSKNRNFFKNAVLEDPPIKVVKKEQLKSKSFDPDWDFDGIAHSKDKCPFLPEDKDGYRDRDGCPDLDNDHDLVLDIVDHCPKVRGLKRFKGCPNPTDWDNDGIPNRIDKCPKKPERINGIKDKDGCPDGAGSLVPCREPVGVVKTFVFKANTTVLIRSYQSKKRLKPNGVKARVGMLRYNKYYPPGPARHLAMLRSDKVLLDLRKEGIVLDEVWIWFPHKTCNYGTCDRLLEDEVSVTVSEYRSKSCLNNIRVVNPLMIRKKAVFKRAPL